jgi:predicted DsbA family dithiol-disulfide isomerase
MTSANPSSAVASDSVTIDVYSDVVCPWCYIGHRRLATALEALPEGVSAQVTFRPYQLDPGASDTPEPVRARLNRKFGPQAASMLARVTEQAQGEGLEMDWDRALSVNTRTAHRLLEYARRHEGGAAQPAVIEELFALYFTNGGDMSDIEQLADAAARAGLDRERVRAHLDSDEGVQELEQEFEAARRLGVQAVPTFVVDGRYAVQGAQSAEALVETIVEVARRKRGALQD